MDRIRSFAKILLGLGPLLAAAPVRGAETAGEGGGGPRRSGHASAELLLESAACQPGDTLLAGVRLALDQGWHTYWVNPGEAGMGTRLEWKLPAGWSVASEGLPFPARFATGGLTGYGYEGVVVIPVALRAGAVAGDGVKLSVKVSWLMCDEGGCVPGEADLEGRVAAGPKRAGPAAAELRRALGRVPAEWPGARLALADAGAEWELRLWPPREARVEPGKLVVFAETPQVLDTAAEPRFEPRAGHWVARVRKSEYATGAAQGLVLVLDGGGLARPVRVAWRAGG